MHRFFFRHIKNIAHCPHQHYIMPNWSLLGALALPNIGGWSVALAGADDTKGPDGRSWYASLRRPSWNPPDWVFGSAWTGLYTGMGYASYVVYKECDEALVPLALYGGQLIINWTWALVFFKMHKIGLALIHLLALDVAATACSISFYKVNPNTVFFMTPYLCWLAFATCLNHSLWELNKDEKTE